MTNTKKLANMYSGVGTNQLLAAVYVDQLVLYAQVEPNTAMKIAVDLLDRPVLEPIEPSEWSSDGMTHCWTFRRSETGRSTTDWLVVAMIAVSGALRENVPKLLTNDCVPYLDNRNRDANTIESFCSFLKDIPFET